MQSNTHECYHLRVKVGKFYLVLGLSGNGYRAALCTHSRLEICREIQVWGKFTGAFFSVIVLDKRLYGFGMLLKANAC